MGRFLRLGWWWSPTAHIAASSSHISHGLICCHQRIRCESPRILSSVCQGIAFRMELNFSMSCQAIIVDGEKIIPKKTHILVFFFENPSENVIHFGDRCFLTYFCIEGRSAYLWPWSQLTSIGMLYVQESDRCETTTD